MELQYEKDNLQRKPFEHYVQEYASKDPAEVTLRTGCPYMEEKSAFLVRFMNKDYEVGFPEFSVKRTREDTSFCTLTEMNKAQVLVMRFLSECCHAPGTGKFLTYREVPWGETYYRQFSGRCLSRLAFSYGNKPELFCKALEGMGAKAVKAADAAYELEIFPDFYVRFLIWAGDDEFPPSAQILFSDNFASAVHAEDLVVISELIISTMKYYGK